MNLSTFMKLGRISNLPTVWTNTLAGGVLAGGSAADWRLGILVYAMTLAYIGGMFLNDAFDREIDAKERPERPIPSGEVTASSVFTYGFFMLAAAVGLVAWCVMLSPQSSGAVAVGASLGLVGCIVVYNGWHKNNPISPFIMGLCRMLVYITAGLALTQAPDNAMYYGAIIVLCYLIGLTYTAKQENLGEVKNLWPLIFLAVPLAVIVLPIGLASGAPTLLWLCYAVFIVWLIVCLRFVFRRGPGDIPRAVVSMIAGISLIDAMFIAAYGHTTLAMLALGAFGLTLLLQRYVSGT